MASAKMDYGPLLPLRDNEGDEVAALPMESSILHQSRDNPPDLPVPLKFGPSHAHRIWRMMQALIKVHPNWADATVFEQARERMLTYGLSIGLTVEDLFSMTDPDAVLGLWKATLAAEQDLWE